MELITFLGCVLLPPIMYKIYKHKIFKKCYKNYHENDLHYSSKLVKRPYLEEKYCQLNNDNDFCAICTEPFINNEIIIRLPCKHYFHKIEYEQPSIFDWVKTKNKCPVCNQEIE